MAEEKILTYKGYPLMRKDKLVYLGSMADEYIILLQTLNSQRRSLSSCSAPIPMCAQRIAS